jgi:signal transduction histidine kinase
MKLLVKTNIYSSLVTLSLLTLGIFLVYRVILIKLDSDIDKQLLIAKEKIIKGLAEGKTPEQFSSNIGEKIKIREIYKQNKSDDDFSEYNLADIDNEDEYSVQRELIFQTTTNDIAYEVSVSRSLSEGRAIGEYILIAGLVFLFLSVAILFFLNRYLSVYIWSPFYDTLTKIKTWNIKKSDVLDFKNTNIDEFHLLNDTVKDLTQQIKSDYQNLKEFTENVSHEAQTPLSIISSKVELLLQLSNYSEKQHELLLQIYRATQRLHKLNEVLILLSRIENKQFIEVAPMNILDAMNEKVQELEDFIEAKGLLVQIHSSGSVFKEVNPQLLNILINNLWINAIKYNIDEGGFIKLTIDNESFSIENNSSLPKIDKAVLFERFKKESTSGSLGVGLSLIKKIIDFFNWQITYSHKDGVHKFKIYM